MKKYWPIFVIVIVVAIGIIYNFNSNPNAAQENQQEESESLITQEADTNEAEDINTIEETTNMNNTQAQVTELKIEDLVVGAGPEVKSGDTVVMHYKGTLLDGSKFDSSYDRGEPFETSIGAGRVIKGWDEGVPGMKKGGKRKLTIPANMAYGERGVPGAIPPNSPLIFEVELLEIK